MEKDGSEAEVLGRLPCPHRSLGWHAATVAVFLLLVLDMIFKPRA